MSILHGGPPPADTPIRKEMPSVQLARDEFAQRLKQRFDDPAFAPLKGEIDKIVEVAWQAYDDYRKAPRTRKAGPGYADPNYDLSVECIEASRRIK